jgi:hypothetical protein
VFADTWKWDGNTWSRCETVERVGRTHFSMSYDSLRKVVVQFGGKDSEMVPYGDFWRFENEQWILDAAEGPPPRIDNGLEYDSVRKSVVMFGGKFPRRDDNAFGDTWEWNDKGWNQLQSSNQS